MAGWTVKDSRQTWKGEFAADTFYGDGSHLTGVVGTGDNLGDHVATQTVSGADLAFSGHVSGATYEDVNIDHNALTNTHNLTTDISHDSISDVSADDHHPQIHNINTHTMGDNKIIHTKAAGAITEIGLGAAGTFLRSAGEGADMTFAVPTNTTYTAGDDLDLTSTVFSLNIGVSTAVTANTAHSVGDGSDHTHVAANTASLATVVPAYQSTSAAYIAHAADASDPHGVTLTQTNLTGTSVSCASLYSTADHDTLSMAIVQNIVIGTGAVASEAVTYPRGTIYIEYTP